MLPLRVIMDACDCHIRYLSLPCTAAAEDPQVLSSRLSDKDGILTKTLQWCEPTA